MPDLRRASGTVHRLSRILAAMRPWLTISLAATLILSGCNSEIYLRDGVTDGDTFYLAERALADDDPAYQSWVRYSLSKSACQLQMGDSNPARSSSYECELSARRILVTAWEEKKAVDPSASDAYLDDLRFVQQSGYLQEHVVRHFGRRYWKTPNDIDSRSYRRWLAIQIPDHKPETRWVGSWNYARNVRSD